MLLVLLPPGVQLSLHGVHVLLDVVHDLPQRQGAATNQLDGRAKPLGLPAHHLPLFSLCRFGQQELKSEGWETNMLKLNLKSTNKRLYLTVLLTLSIWKGPVKQIYMF